MLLVQLMKPFYTKLEGDRIKLVFAYQYFSVKKDDELFHFIPVEARKSSFMQNRFKSKTYPIYLCSKMEIDLSDCHCINYYSFQTFICTYKQS